MRLLRRVLRGLVWLFNWIPRGTRVDPALFSDAEYPVWCMRCGYWLSGLPEPRCPECGEAFDRGVLLVEEYARGRRPRSDWWYRVSRWLWTITIACMISQPVAVLTLAVLPLRWFSALLAARSGPLLLKTMFLGPMYTALAALVVSALIDWTLVSLPPLRKRGEVRKAAIRATYYRRTAR
jgi:hypothetical protein